MRGDCEARPECVEAQPEDSGAHHAPDGVQERVHGGGRVQRPGRLADGGQALRLDAAVARLGPQPPSPPSPISSSS